MGLGLVLGFGLEVRVSFRVLGSGFGNFMLVLGLGSG